MDSENTIRLYMNGVKYNEDGTEAEYVEIEESQQFALYSLGWRVSDDN